MFSLAENDFEVRCISEISRRSDFEKCFDVQNLNFSGIEKCFHVTEKCFDIQCCFTGV